MLSNDAVNQLRCKAPSHLTRRLLKCGPSHVEINILNDEVALLLGKGKLSTACFRPCSRLDVLL